MIIFAVFVKFFKELFTFLRNYPFKLPLISQNSSNILKNFPFYMEIGKVMNFCFKETTA